MKPVALCAICLALAACAAPSGGPPVAAEPAASRGFGADLNAYRTGRGLAPLARNAGLTRAARLHAEDMARAGYFSHRGRDGSSAAERIGRQGCGGHTAENIAQGYPSEAAVLAGWKRSAGHDRNLLRREVRHYGLARAAGDTWVLVLASDC